MLTKPRLYILATLLSLGAAVLLSFSFTNHAYADSSTLIGMVNNGDIYVKSGSTTAPWTTRLTTGETATQLEMYGDRVAFVDSNNNLWLKQGLTGQWYEEMGNVQSYALTENGLLVLQSGGDVWYKNGSSPTAQWDSNLIASDGVKVYLSPSQMVIIDTSGNLLGKALTPNIIPEGWGPDSDWLPMANNVASAAINDIMTYYIDNQGNVFVKPGSIDASTYGGSFGTGIADNATQLALVSNNLYCWISSSTLLCRPIFPNPNYAGVPLTVWGSNTTSYSLSPGVFVVSGNDGDGNNYLYGMDYSQISYGTPSGYVLNNSSGWHVLSTTGTEITTNQE